MDKRFTSLNNWSQKLFFDLFQFLEPSLFCGAVRPTDSHTVLRQLMERCFGYNTGVVFGQTATTLSIQKRTKREQFEILRFHYINNGRPLRNIQFENQIVDWEAKGNGIYRSFIASKLPPNMEPPTATDKYGFCVMNTLTLGYVSVPAISIGTISDKDFLNLKIQLNHNEKGAQYEIPNGVPVKISELFERAHKNVDRGSSDPLAY